MKHTFHRVMAIFLTLVMCLALIPLEILAAEDGNIDVTFVVEGEEVASMEIPYGWYVDPAEVPAEATAAAEALDTEDYRFEGWYDEQGRGLYYYLYEDTTYTALYSWDVTLTFMSADGKELGKQPLSSITSFNLSNIDYSITQAVEEAIPERMWFKGWAGDDGEFYYPYSNYTFTKDLTLTATYDWWRTVDFKDVDGNGVASFDIHNDVTPTSSNMPMDARKLLAHSVDKVYLGYMDDKSNLYGSQPVTADTTYTLMAHDATGEMVEFHKATSYSDLQAGAHYVIVVAVTDEVTGDVTRYMYGSNSSNLNIGGAVYTTQTAEDYNAGILRLPSDAESIFTLLSLSKQKDMDGIVNAATVSMQANNGLMMKLGTSSGNTAPILNSSGGTITASLSSSGLWSLANGSRYLNYSRNYTGSYTECPEFTVYYRSTAWFEIYTDATEDTLGEARYVEYTPLGNSLTDFEVGDEMLIVYTDKSGHSYALTNGAGGPLAVPVTVENNIMESGHVTTSITTDRINTWEVMDQWETMDDAVSGMESDENLTVLRNTLTRGIFDLWVSSSAVVRNNTENAAQVFFYVDNTDPENPQIRLHGDRKIADRYLGWDGEEFYASGLSYDDSITVRIYGPARTRVSYQTQYVRVDQLESLASFTSEDKFIVVLPTGEDAEGNPTYQAMGFSSGNKWLYDVNVENGVNQNGDPIEYVMVDSTLPIVFNGDFTGYTYPGGSSAPYLTFNNIGLTNNTYCFYPQNLNSSKVPFRTNSDSKGRYEYASKTDPTIYIRGNSSSSYLTCIDGVYSAAAISDDRQPVQIYAPVNDSYVNVRFVDVDGDISSTAYVQGSVKLDEPAAELWLDAEKNLCQKDDDGAKRYIFVGWSTNEKFGENFAAAFLDTEHSANLYESYRLPGEENATSKVKDEIRTDEYYNLVGLCQKEKQNTANLSDYADAVDEDGNLYLYPVYAEAGYDTYVTAYENASAARSDDAGLPIIGVSDTKSTPTNTGYYEPEKEIWLGSIDVEVYKDGNPKPWVSDRMYFSYHNDNCADLNVKFIWNNILDDVYGGNMYDYLSISSVQEIEDKGYDAAGLDSSVIFPPYDQVGHFVLDAVYAEQGNSEDGLMYRLNWISSNGGRLDNVAGGTTVKLYVTTIYDAKFYLEDTSRTKNIGIIELGTIDGTYNTPGTKNLFEKDSADAEYKVSADNYPDLLFESDRTDELITPTMARGGYDGFSYKIGDFNTSFTLFDSPAASVPQGYRLVDNVWHLKTLSSTSRTTDLTEVGTHGYSSEFELEGDVYGSGNTGSAYVDGEASFEASTPQTFHFYAPIKRMTGDLTVSKTVVGKDADMTKAFNFTVTLSDTTVNGEYGEMTFTGGVATFALTNGQTKTAEDLPAGISYTVTEEADGYYAMQAVGADGVIIEDETVTASFTNTRKTGDLTVSKTVVGKDADKTKAFNFTVTLSDRTISGDYGEMTFAGGVATFTLTDGQTKTAEGLPTGISYTVTEEADGDYTTNSTGATGEIEYNVTKDASFTNTRKTGDLTVSKTVVGKDADTTKAFTFTVRLSDTTINGDYGEMTFTGGVAIFTLTHGQSKTAEGLPTGISYTVTETADDEYTTEYTGETGDIEYGVPKSASFTNTRKTGDLTVTKTVKGKDGDKTKAFNFTVKLSDTTINGDYGEMTFTGGVATFTLTDGQKKTATGLPTGISYTVTETDDDEYTTEYTGTTGDIEYNVEKSADFTNTRKTGDLAVSKTVTGKDADLTKVFNFTITLDDTTISGEYGDITFSSGVANFTLIHGQTKTAEGLPTGVTYTVTEADAFGYTATYTGKTGIIEENATKTARITNDRDTGSLTVSKIVTGNNADPFKEFTFTVTLSDTSISGIYGNMEFVGGVATFTLTHGDIKTATGLPTGVTYTVTEADAEGYTASYTGETGTIEKDVVKAAVITNDRDTGSLTVTKTVTGKDGDIEMEFTFIVTLSDTSISGTYGDMEFVDGVATFTLKHGEVVTAEGLPTGVTYTVVELDAEGYTASFTGESGTIEKDEVKAAEFTNDRDTGSLTVTKTVTGKDGDTDKEFTFTVTLSDTSISGIYGDMEFVDGVAIITLKHGESKTAEGLPTGVTYTVVEEDAEGYTSTYTGESGTIVKDVIFTAEFVNDRDTGSLTVSKTVTGNGGDKNKEFTFTVTLSDKTINGTYGDMEFVNGVATFTLKHGESKTAEGLPTGVTYTVTESDNDGYTVSSKGEKGEIAKDTTAKAEFVNDKPEVIETPQTGDNGHIGFYVMLAIISLLGMAVFTVTFAKSCGKRRKASR